MTFGEMRSKAFQHNELIENLSEIVILSNIPQTEMFQKTGISKSHFARRLKKRTFTPGQMVAIFRVIVEESNYLRVKAKE